ncbi:MAG TPA: hypothetical protein VGG74_29910 [Kofleriaceae bacterium]|jgi:hypothetical protein
MVKWLVKKRIAAFERQWGYDASYMRELLDTDLRALLAFAKLQGLDRYRRDAPADAYYAAKLVAVLAEDCGPCTQLAVGMALADRVPGATLAAVIERRDADLPSSAALAVRFARAALAHDAAASELRDQIIATWGPRALVSLAFAILTGRMFPTLKFALGHGHACERVMIDGKAIVPRPAA